MTVPEIKKGRGLAEVRAERRSEALGSERLPDVLGMRHELDAETAAGLQAGHEALQTMGNVNETGVDFPPELRLKIKEIQKEAAGKLRGLDATLSRMREQFLAIANFLSGGLFETGQPRAREQNKFASGFYRDKKGKSIGKQERSKLESKVDMQLVRERATDVREYLTDRIHSSDVVLLGEIHSHETIEKRAVAGFLEQTKASGTTHVGVEIPAYYQEAVDRYMATGKFNEADDPADYERVDEYHRLYSEQLAQPEQPKQADKLQKDEFGKYEVIQPEGMTDELFAFERKMRKNFLFKNHLSKDFRLLQGIREAGLTPVCLDANASYGASQELDSGLDAVGRGEMTMDELKKRERELEKQRDVFMAQKIREVVERGGKMLAVLGNTHVARKGMDGRENVADLLGETDMKTTTINLDRDCDADPELSYYRRNSRQSLDTSANSVLFSAIGKDADLANRSIGFDLDQIIIGEKTPAPYDGYIRLKSEL